MSSAVPHIAVCICTFKRAALLRRLLDGLRDQRTDGRFTYSVVVADNDAAASGREVVNAFTATSALKVVYCVEPVQNFALVRNCSVAHAEGEFFAFVDDDECPVKDWLFLLFDAAEKSGASGVLGPVLPQFEEEPPAWVRKGGFCDRPRHQTGFKMPWAECRTGNVLLRRKILADLEVPFRKEFRTGGEDVDFYHRAAEKGHQFIWCDEAEAYEVVPPVRWTRRFMLSRALLRGRNTFLQPKDRLRNLAKSAIAVPAYALALPVLLVAGHHYFMKYLIKLADHAGRLLASCGLNPVRERPM
jgi:succinoglycan biosynthesis protein ExoM